MVGNVFLFQEYCRSCNNYEKCDKYNLDCEIKNDKGEVVFRTRYKDFPW